MQRRLLFPPQGGTHVRVLLPEDIYNRSPGFCALVIWEETPSPLPIGYPTDGLTELSRYHCLMESPSHSVFLLLAVEGGPALSGSPFHLGVPHQARVLTPLPEVHPPGYPCPDLMGPADAQCLC